MNRLKINDIKPLVEVSDYSFYFFITLIICFIILLTYILYFIYKKIKNKKIDYSKIYIKKLQKIDVSKSKNAAYSITKYCNAITKNEEQTLLANALIENLTQYKYKKNIPPFNKTTINLYQQLMEKL